MIPQGRNHRAPQGLQRRVGSIPAPGTQRLRRWQPQAPRRASTDAAAPVRSRRLALRQPQSGRGTNREGNSMNKRDKALTVITIVVWCFMIGAAALSAQHIVDTGLRLGLD